MKAKNVLKTMKPYQPGKGMEEVKKEFGLEKIVKLASNENPYGFSPEVKRSLPHMIENLEVYPDGYAAELRKKVASHLSVNEDQLIFGNGSDEVVQIICRTFLEPGANTIMATPTFPQYKHNALIEGAEVREVPLVDGHHDLEEMLRQIDENSRVLWLCTPNNPTGIHIDRDSMTHALKQVPDHVLVVLDEAYYEYMTCEDAFNSITSLDKYPNMMVLRTFSKAYGLAGLRIGYGVAHHAIIRALEPAREPFNTSSVAQASAILALEDQAFIERAVVENKRNMQRLFDFLNEKGLGYFESEANFVLIKLPISGDEMFQHLLTKGFIVRSGEALGIPNTIRLTIGKEKDMVEIQSEIASKISQGVK